MAKDDEFKRIRTEIPNSPFFALAFPAPEEKDFERIASNPEVFILTDGVKQVKAIRRDFRIFDWYHIPDLFCWVTYGKNATDTWDMLTKTYPDMGKSDKVAFFLFERLKD